MNGEAISGVMNEGAGVQVRNTGLQWGHGISAVESVMRHEYKTPTHAELDQINLVKDHGLAFYATLNGCTPGREISIAKTKLEECVFWAVKGLTACLVLLFVAGCATYADLPQDHIARTLVSEQRSPFGTNGGFMKLEHCEKQYDKQHVFYEPVNCTTIIGWTPISSQGQGGQIVGGALTGVGAAVGGMMVETGASVTQSVITAPGKGHH